MRCLSATIGLAALLLLTTTSTASAQLSEFAVATGDSTPLWSAPRSGARLIRYAFPGEQFRVLRVAEYGKWLRVTTEIYRDAHVVKADSAWALAKDLHLESSQTAYASLSFDLSLLEVPEGSFPLKVGADQFLRDPGSLPASYYVSACYVPNGFPDICSGPYGTCGHIYIPGEYFIAGEPGADSSRYERLFNNGTVRPIYRIESRMKLRELSARLLITRNVYAKHDCYDEVFLRRETRHLLDTTLVVGDYKAGGNFVLPSSVIWKPDGKGEAGSAVLTMLVDLVPESFPGWKSRLVRTIAVWWPACY